MRKPASQGPPVKRWMREHGREVTAAAIAIGMSTHILHRKVNGITLFTYAEALDLARFERAEIAELFPDNDGIDPREVRAHLSVAEGVA